MNPRINKSELVETLKRQHRELQEDLRLAAVESEKALDNLKKFKADLLAHLDLENNVFYPEYRKQMEEIGGEITETNKFIAEMDDIGKVVMAFLDKYGDEEKIKQARFKEDLADIVATLNLRIETEEDGVYDLFVVEG